MIDKHKQLFAEEAHEILGDLETFLLDLEASPDDIELVNQVFRALHTLKGSGAMFGFEEIAILTHEVETVYDLVRSGSISVSKKLIDLTLMCRDQVRLMLEYAFTDEKVDSDYTDKLIASFRTFLPLNSSDDTVENIDEVSGDTPEKSRRMANYRIRFKPNNNTFLRGTNPVGLLRELADIGLCRTVVQLENIPPLDEINPEECFLYWDVLLSTDKGINVIKDVFIFVEDDSVIDIELINHDTWDESSQDLMKLGEILVEKGDISIDVLDKTINEKKKLGETLIEEGLVDSGKIDAAIAEQEHLRETRLQRRSFEQVASIRVKSEKLDSLVNLVGEMVTVQARLSQESARQELPELTIISEIVERLTWEMRDHILNIRMIPIGTTFTKFNRLVRDLSGELGKSVELVTEGAETELDKTVIERLSDPLVHLIRNCIDHGIEQPEERKEKGKNPFGKVTLSAQHAGAHVLIRVEDDGAGLKAGVIRKKAIDQGLISDGVELSDKDLFSTIFSSGFSTAKKVTNVSGRGVGMDVVRKAIDELRGTIDIESVEGQGTAFVIKLPLTLAIIDGLLVKIAEKYFIFPLSSVEECVEINRSSDSNNNGKSLANVRGELIPYINLRTSFDITEEAPEIEQIVITNTLDRKIGFLVDSVIGGHQTVIKSLGSMYRDVDGLSGATILGDGTVALILDMVQLIRSAEMERFDSLANMEKSSI